MFTPITTQRDVQTNNGSAPEKSTATLANVLTPLNLRLDLAPYNGGWGATFSSICDDEVRVRDLQFPLGTSIVVEFGKTPTEALENFCSALGGKILIVKSADGKLDAEAKLPVTITLA